MVFFTCNGCGESLKKAQVEKHVAKCRNCQCLSCIDCGKDFWGNDYKTHLKCISENEKYGGKAFEATAVKGDVKQQEWIQRIQEVMKRPNISKNIRDILDQMSSYDNVPRKKTKFQNWMKNSLQIYNQSLQDKVWEIFAEASSTQKDTNNNAPKTSNTTAAGSTSESPAATEETEKKKSKRERKEERQKKSKKEKKDLDSEDQLQNDTKKKGKKRKMKEDEITEGSGDGANDEEAAAKKKKKQQEHVGEDDPENKEDDSSQQKKQNDPEGKFNWKGTIKALLRKAPDNELPIKKLRKKVIAQYYAISSEQHKSQEEVLAMFNKKMQKNPKFRVLKEKVKLVK